MSLCNAAIPCTPAILAFGITNETNPYPCPQKPNENL